MPNPRKISPIAWPDDDKNRATAIPPHDVGTPPPEPPCNDEPAWDRESGIRRIGLPSVLVDKVVADLASDPRRDA
jgi:hypothetical protein